MIESDPLWGKLQQLELEQLGGSLTFADRLAAENGWGKDFTLRVISEYRRFVYLAARAGHKVTPSTVIDEAWHLHLLYTESYWNNLCATVLERPLHHGPTKGGVAEEEKFRSWYQQTLKSYQRIFCEEAPADIWPNSRSMRTGRLKRYQLIDSANYFAVPRPRIHHLPQVVVMGAACLVFIGARGEGSSFGWDEPFFPLLVIGVIYFLMRKQKGRSGSCSGGCGSGTDYSSDTHDGGDGGDGGGDGGGGDGGGCGGGCGGD